MLFSQSTFNNRDCRGNCCLSSAGCPEPSGELRASRCETSDEPTHPEPSRPLVGRLLNLHPLQRHVVDGTFLNFLPPVLHRALEMKQKESFNIENFVGRLSKSEFTRFVKGGGAEA